jgi:hypothetical protein
MNFQNIGIRWVDEAPDRDTLIDVIVDKPRSKLKEAVTAHKQPISLKPLIKIEVPTPEPKFEVNHTATNTKQLQNGPLVFNMQMHKHIDDSFEQAKQIKRKQLQKENNKGTPTLIISASNS